MPIVMMIITRHTRGVKEEATRFTARLLALIERIKKSFWPPAAKLAILNNFEGKNETEF